jgi:methylamine dehydrogenase accessory protein MauD
MNETTLIISNGLLWLVVLGLCAVVVALIRQIGVLHERIAPAGALMMSAGPQVGEPVPEFSLQTLGGRPLLVGGTHEQARSTLLFFLAPTCPVCKTLLPVLRSCLRSERNWLDIVLASDGDVQEHLRFIEKSGLQDFAYVVSSELGMSLQVGKLPYVILIDEHGILRAKGLVNSREHLESLFEAKELGVASIQEYLERHGDAA